MDEFKVTYTRHTVLRWLKETLTITKWDISIEKDNSFFLAPAGSDSMTIPIEGLKKVELRSRYRLSYILLGLFVDFCGIALITDLDTFIFGVIMLALSVLIYLNVKETVLQFKTANTAITNSYYNISVPYFESSKMSQAQKAIRAVMAYETEKRDTTKHSETISDALLQVADAISGRPTQQTTTRRVAQRPTQKAIAAQPARTTSQTRASSAQQRTSTARTNAQTNRQPSARQTTNSKGADQGIRRRQ